MRQHSDHNALAVANSHLSKTGCPWTLYNTSTCSTNRTCCPCTKVAHPSDLSPVRRQYAPTYPNDPWVGSGGGEEQVC